MKISLDSIRVFLKCPFFGYEAMTCYSFFYGKSPSMIIPRTPPFLGVFLLIKHLIGLFRYNLYSDFPALFSLAFFGLVRGLKFGTSPLEGNFHYFLIVPFSGSLDLFSILNSSSGRLRHGDQIKLSLINRIEL